MSDQPTITLVIKSATHDSATNLVTLHLASGNVVILPFAQATKLVGDDFPLLLGMFESATEPQEAVEDLPDSQRPVGARFDIDHFGTEKIFIIKFADGSESEPMSASEAMAIVPGEDLVHWLDQSTKEAFR